MSLWPFIRHIIYNLIGHDLTIALNIVMIDKLYNLLTKFGSITLSSYTTKVRSFLLSIQPDTWSLNHMGSHDHMSFETHRKNHIFLGLCKLHVLVCVLIQWQAIWYVCAACQMDSVRCCLCPFVSSIVCGFGGALFVYTHRKMVEFMRRQQKIKQFLQKKLVFIFKRMFGAVISTYRIWK